MTISFKPIKRRHQENEQEFNEKDEDKEDKDITSIQWVKYKKDSKAPHYTVNQSTFDLSNDLGGDRQSTNIDNKEKEKAGRQSINLCIRLT